MKFLNYLLEQYSEWTEGFSGYPENIEESFREDIYSFFESLLIYTEDVREMANEFGADIISLTMMKLKEYTEPGNYYYEGEHNPLKRYCELENFVWLAIDTLYETHYNKFLNVFMER